MKAPKIKQTVTVAAIRAAFPLDEDICNTGPTYKAVSLVGTKQADAVIYKSECENDVVPIEGSSGSFEWKTADLKRKVAEYSLQGRLSSDLLDEIRIERNFAPIEFESLDYKEDLDTSQYGKGKLVLRIVSFYNSYGGYLVFGIRETESETKFEAIGFDKKKLDLESVKALIKTYTGERVQISTAEIKIPTSEDDTLCLTVLHIPQRPLGIPPLHFIKDGPGNSKKVPLFFKDSVFCRRGDECVEAKGPKILELNTERKNPYLFPNGIAIRASFRKDRLQHNLPDRSFICAKFVGRDSILNLLWRWLGDDLSHMKVLAGEGGLGKSSIAYEFAERVSETPGVPFEQVIWLTAKEQQFKAFDDQYVSVPERHFSTYEELLFAICSKLPFTTDELEGTSTLELKRMVKSGLTETPSLFIIDDVDSLLQDEQKKVFELGSIIASSSSRLLLTTRFNQSVSTDNVFKLEGLTMPDEFPQYMETLQERLQFPPLNQSEIEKIHATSEGSPLYSESLVRLLKWYSVSESISQWQGSKGVAVRDAALKREIDTLTSEAKRILLTVATLVEASAIELCEVLGYPSEQIERCLAELEALFLVAAPALASVRRFRIPENTRRLVQDNTDKLITDRVRFDKDLATFRKNSLRTPTRDARVASAISQAAAFVRVGNISTALTTIQDARRKTKNHFDLLSYQATLYMKDNPKKPDLARKLAREAVNKGARKNEVFECWFEAEWAVNHYIGALEAAEAALTFRAAGEVDWTLRKSAALASKAHDQAQSGSYATAVNTMFEASTTLRSIISSKRTDFAADWEEQQGKLHDQIWFWAGADEAGVARTSAQLIILQKFWDAGDYRITNLRRILSAMDGMAGTIARSINAASNTQKDFYNRLIQKANELFIKRQQKFDSDTRHKDLKTKFDVIRLKIENSLAGLGNTV